MINLLILFIFTGYRLASWSIFSCHNVSALSCISSRSVLFPSVSLSMSRSPLCSSCRQSFTRRGLATSFLLIRAKRVGAGWQEHRESIPPIDLTSLVHSLLRYHIGSNVHPLLLVASFGLTSFTLRSVRSEA